ncbi:C39 family peptidase [Vagococcus sp. DIV0080]|uniref:C39 family peptidase n=1 Tax=Candidatus Vagococcus giribetii TaxID=2230876 RepID=A0ABS3HTR5_9ENTE|nr:C39 family peptidase [Vagococcus sp. DIV0080]MBO0477149.1 C39 family peptidase [Vagococcus sp. DIV0080]
MSIKKTTSLLILSILFVISGVSYIYLNKINLNNDLEKKHNVQQAEVASITEKKVIETSYVDQINDRINKQQFSNRLNIPLILQTDKKWANTFYGSDSSDVENNTIKINGCALVSLAMISSYLDNKNRTPLDILFWSGDAYFIENQGTSWNIFSDFSVANGYQMINLGTDFEAVKEQLLLGNPVIISVKPGKFTKVGHIMILSGYDSSQNTFWLNDPNDSEEKQHSTTPFSQGDLESEVVNFWSFSK